ncbi:alpha/beta hydrolase [Xinfangfangia sp. D13-10-4-6]|uniref:alpha/beta fold hydrolase n=1 Tax=Pseudogemmobacter hezensis TaxID=2737662 RepID=UPI001557EC2C|nr:alpha/beta hydrolase [Pseudogemmobacter hezensis]NPD17336.1 alpha/beta hydrolase [Pseudogemmobacter hezensis]
MTTPAPLHHELADGPEGGGAVWLRTADGVRIRLGYWPCYRPGGPLGTVVFLPGRTEYIEKYGPTAKELGQRGWSMIALDWRGQGLSDRALADPMLGHVGHFSEYQLDLDAALAWLAQQGAGLGLSGPLMLMSHSMGGLIGLRSLMRGAPFRASVFSAPMWGIRIPLWGRPLASALRRLPLALPQDRRFAPSTSGESYILRRGFEGNQLTGDAQIWSWLHHQLQERPDFRLGGPSLGWLRAALRECAVLARMPSPALPVQTSLGSLEQIVRPDAIRQRMAHWPQGRLDLYPGARHEVPMEAAPHRSRFYDAAHQLFFGQREG